MMKTQKTTTASLMMVTAIMLCSSLQAQDPIEIIRKVEDNMRGDASYTELTMTTERPRYTREISMKSWSLGDEYALLLITAPARDKGTAFLKRGNEIWNYVPNIDRTVKMPPSMMAQSWMGSDFSNDDLVRGSSTVDDYTHTLLRSEIVDGHDCYVLELIPKPDAPIVFDKVIYWVSKQHYLPVKIENYDEFGDLASTINFKDISEMGGRMIPVVMEMIPATRSGHKTVLTTHKADYDVKLDQSFFSLQNLTNIR
jgi:outer membrane lipoprotein-sorting protein